MLLDPAEQEDVVVHREPEQYAEEEQREPELDGRRLLEPEEVSSDTLLEHQHEQSVSGTHGEEVHHDRLDRDRPGHLDRRTLTGKVID